MNRYLIQTYDKIDKKWRDVEPVIIYSVKEVALFYFENYKINFLNNKFRLCKVEIKID